MLSFDSSFVYAFYIFFGSWLKNVLFTIVKEEAASALVVFRRFLYPGVELELGKVYVVSHHFRSGHS